MIVKCKLTPTSGGETMEIKNITSLSYGTARREGPNRRLGSAHHEIDYISLSRRKSLPEEGGTPDLDDSIVDLASREGKKAYFSGEVTIAYPDDEMTEVETIRWDEGFITSFNHVVSGESLDEAFTICVTRLKVGDFDFKPIRQ